MFLNRAYSTENLLKAYQDDCNRPHRQFYVACKEEQIIGYAELAEHAPAHFELTRIYLLPSFQGLGIGKQLLTTLFNAQPHIHQVFAWVEKENHRGRQFYQAMNFLPVEQMEDDFFGKVTTLVKYQKDVSC
ncbi:GNAT family N-acetyltransferase [Melghirimyces algeriensis]|uniref:Acetyltransferase (GNAT) family protein n=1 Tax=Melghirimyces algeriensis TaxID=910412 RepID=A0A521EX00_9BACL|nr:GNAT family N-acetyltransferase [Melghirimyces algeriensis]SMO88437.1 Acetyltransferase (GNAT) family protein [Melghirimyces algeriensis]